jgi:hypothetical protein
MRGQGGSQGLGYYYFLSSCLSTIFNMYLIKTLNER